MLIKHQSRRPGLRLCHQGEKLIVPFNIKKTFGDRAFSTSAPALWNALLQGVKCSQNIDELKRNLKTYLFNEHFK